MRLKITDKIQYNYCMRCGKQIDDLQLAIETDGVKETKWHHRCLHIHNTTPPEPELSLFQKYELKQRELLANQ